MSAVMTAARTAPSPSIRNMTRAAAQSAFSGITLAREQHIAATLDITHAEVRSKVSLALSGNRDAFLELQGAAS